MKYFTDGFVLGQNPSKMGGGYTIVDENNNLIKHEQVEKIGFTNNDGEILGIYEAAKISSLGDIISTDSMCSLAWVNKGKSKVRQDLNELFRETKKLITEKNINLMWERRDYNLAGIYNESRPRSKFKENRIKISRGI